MFYKESMEVLQDLFGRDCTFVMATVREQAPSQRVVDTCYSDGAFWIVTYALSNKVRELAQNPNAALCSQFQTFKGKAYNAGHPLEAQNREIREKLIRAFAPWYFVHNDENDPNMCYVKFEPEEGFFHKDGVGYRVNFVEKTAEKIPFTPQIVEPE